MGPDFWGLLNPDWNLCSKGRRQSPVDLNPNTLLFDPHLKPLHVDKSRPGSETPLVFACWASLRAFSNFAQPSGPSFEANNRGTAATRLKALSHIDGLHARLLSRMLS
ncbi:hypothetical protein HPB50_016195 [Hyalomma asiaticum]|uniref:Uncharacterized protein n=1 Tax=Hyalomma asiaticum TaxID=266040 RepID=A0ACB7SRD7_HYAAI|nr:hypothetical protein HPB50_016195 [Hyalomma asiaticum]